MIELPIPDKRIESPDPVKVQMLKECLEFLWNGIPPYNGEDYICYSLEQTEKYKDNPESFDSLVGGIRSRIGGNHSFITWLLNKGFNYPTCLERQTARRRFVLQLIEEFGGHHD